MEKQRIGYFDKKYLWIVATCIGLTACVDTPAPITESPTVSPHLVETATQTATPLPTAMPSPTPIPSPTVSPPLTPTQGPTPTATPILPTPALPSSVQSDFLLGGNSPECRLPCWNGLIIGDSNLTDIQRVFDEVFGFNGMREFFPTPSHIEGIAYVDYEWYTSGGGWEDLYVVFWMDEDSYTLQGISFSWNGDRTQITLRSILRELGPPSHLWMLLGGAQAFSVRYDVVAIYEEQGIAFLLLGRLPAEIIIRPDNSVEVSTEACLEEQFSTEIIYIIEPLENGLRVRDMSPLQESAIGSVRRDRRYLDPSEEVLGLTPEELTALAMQDEDVCITVEVEP